MFVVVMAGFALAGSHLLVGLFLTPFFGDGPFLWANIFASFLLSLLGGVVLDSSHIQSFFKKEACAFFYLLIGSTWLAATPLILPQVTRTILDTDPDNLFAALLSSLFLITLPGVLLVGTLPATIRCRPTNQQLKGSQLLLTAFLAGNTLGVFIACPALLSEKYPALLLLGSMAWLPLFYAAWSWNGWFRVLALSAGTALAATLLFAPGELASLEFRAALRRSFKLHVGRYYLATAGRRVLKDADIRHEFERITKSLEGKEDPAAAAIIAMVRTLKGLGPVETTGDGLAGTLKQLLSESTLRYLLPFLESVNKIISDGKGRISFVLKPTMRGQMITIPEGARPEEKVLKLLLKDDFSLAFTQQDQLTNIRVEPEVVEKAGFFEMNETHKTPLRIKDVALWVDAHLLGCTIDNSKTRIVIKVKAQGSVGAVTEEVIYAVEK